MKIVTARDLGIEDGEGVGGDKEEDGLYNAMKKMMLVLTTGFCKDVDVDGSNNRLLEGWQFSLDSITLFGV